MANVIESPMFFTNGKSVVKMGKDGSVKAIGSTYREVPFNAKKWESTGKDATKYCTSVTNVQGLNATDVAAFTAMQKTVVAGRKEFAKTIATFEGKDRSEVERALESTIDNVSRLTVELADEKAVLSQIRVVLKGVKEPKAEVVGKDGLTATQRKLVAEQVKAAKEAALAAILAPKVAA